ncbi:hypothetical protein [Planctobacterium marinum]|uniref:hypothetical protein n=1 Tax=Planctobacterium marinum TaxID=1631968 RepID=UPI001E5AE4A8|nr:hypothetical protein [Planctobacterium marinum]MCC2607909.1 hypothetical protein [Planctobacterium marinum]
MSNDNFEQALQDKVRTLPKEVQPEKDLWQGIDIALTPVGQHRASAESVATSSTVVRLFERHNIRNLALAASLALVAILGWNGLQKSPELSPSSTLVSHMMQQHDEQKSVLLASLSDSPELTDNWQTQLLELEQAASAIEAALQNDPNNITLLKMLQQVHQQQLALIERVHAPAWQQI